MNKSILTLAATAAFAFTAQAQINLGSLGNKAKDKVKKEVNGSGSGSSTPASSGSSGSGTTTPTISTPSKATKAALEENTQPSDYETPNKEYFAEQLRNTMGGQAYYSALLTQGKTDALLAPKEIKEKMFSSDTELTEYYEPNGVIFYDWTDGGKRSKVVYPKIFAIQCTKKQVAEHSWQFNKVNEDAFNSYSSKGLYRFTFDLSNNSSYKVNGDYVMQNVYNTTEFFDGYKKLGDSTIAVYIIKRLPAFTKTKIEDENKNNGYVVLENKFDYDNMTVDVLSRNKATTQSADLDALKKDIAAYVKRELQLRDKGDKEYNDKKMAGTKRTPKGMSNPTLEADLMARSKKIFADGLGAEGDFKGATLTSFRITSKEWTTAKNEYGLIVYRFINTEFIINKDGKCYIGGYDFIQDYQGGGQYATVITYNGSGTSATPILCENAK